jgi:hypothetical protein
MQISAYPQRIIPFSYPGKSSVARTLDKRLKLFTILQHNLLPIF